MNFGGRFACLGNDAQEGKSSWGEQNEQENLEEGEEDRSDEAAVSPRTSTPQCTWTPPFVSGALERVESFNGG